MIRELDSDGNWVYVPTMGSTDSDDYGIDVGADGMPYVVFRSNVDNVVNVMSYNGSTWTSVGGIEPMPFGPETSLQIRADANGFVYVGGMNSGGSFRLWKYDGSAWNPISNPLDMDPVVSFDLALVDQIPFMALTTNTGDIQIYYQPFGSFYWYQIDMPRADIQNPRLSSDGRNLYLVGVEPVNPYGLLIYRLQPYGGFAEMGN